MQIYGVTRYETYGRLIRLVHERVFFVFFATVAYGEESYHASVFSLG